MANRSTTAHKASTATPADTLAGAELVAMAAAIKPKALASARKSIADGAHEAVSFAVQIDGVVQRGEGTPANSGETLPTISLGSRAVLLALAKALGVGPARLRDKLADVTNGVTKPAHLANVAEGLDTLGAALADAEAALAERLGPQPWQSNGTDGRITTALTVRPIPAPLSAAA